VSGRKHLKFIKIDDRGQLLNLVIFFENHLS
jgi:hypothetical protein